MAESSTPEDPSKPADEPPFDITLEEWIAATQSCCGVDHPDDDTDPASPS